MGGSRGRPGSFRSSEQTSRELPLANHHYAPDQRFQSMQHMDDPSPYWCFHFTDWAPLGFLLVLVGSSTPFHSLSADQKDPQSFQGVRGNDSSYQQRALAHLSASGCLTLDMAAPPSPRYERHYEYKRVASKVPRIDGADCEWSLPTSFHSPTIPSSTTDNKPALYLDVCTCCVCLLDAYKRLALSVLPNRSESTLSPAHLRSGKRQPTLATIDIITNHQHQLSTSAQPAS